MSSRRRPSVRPLPRLLAVLVAMLAVLGLASACRVQSGAAAFVGDERVTEADVAGYLSTTSTAAPSTDPSSLTPRAQVLQTLVLDLVLRDYLQQNGGVPSEQQRATDRQQAFTVVTGSGAPDLDQFRTTLTGLGYDAAFVEPYIEQIDLTYVAVQRSGSSAPAELFATISAATPTPKISPRYGTWDASALSLTGSSSTPDYLQLSTPAAA